MATNEKTLQGKRIAFLMANEGVEQMELTEPWKAVEEAGGQPQSRRPGRRQGPGLQPPRPGRHLPGGRGGGEADAPTSTE